MQKVGFWTKVAVPEGILWGGALSSQGDRVQKYSRGNECNGDFIANNQERNTLASEVKSLSHVVSKLKRPLFVASEMSGFG
jgi:hypothetical protein